MTCNHCGSHVPNDSKFCQVCGSFVQDQQPQPVQTPIQQQPIQTPVQAPAQQTVQTPVQQTAQNSKQQSSHTPIKQENAPVTASTEATPKKKKKWILPVAIALGVLLILAALFFFTDIFGPGDGKCDICEGKISKKESYCASCIESHTCKECDTFNPDNVDGYCPDCRKCRSCAKDIETGYYCENCIDDLTGNYVEPFCISCGIKVYDGTYASVQPFTSNPENRLSAEDIFWIDDNGYFYCRNCESDKHCQICDGLLEKTDDDTVCLSCVSSYYSKDYTFCPSCSTEVINKDDRTCDDCTEAKDCRKCETPLPLNDDDDICWDCAQLYCDGCHEVLTEAEIDYSYVTEWEYNYCKDCNTGKYCEGCDYMLDEHDDDDVCYYCADYWCYHCGEVLKYDEVDYRYTDIYGGTNEHVICKDCNTGKYCEDCDYPLDMFDLDRQCLSCAEYTCWDCSEVIEEKEIAHISAQDKAYCKHCDTGNYCEDCDAVLQTGEDDDVCYSCADYTCWYCSEVLKKSEISYTNETEYGTQYYCEDCDSGKYCDDCSGMLRTSDDDDVCYSCADYACWYCNEVLNKSEISYTEDTVYGTHYYCEDCDRRKYCDDCGSMLGKSDDDDVCYECADYVCWDCNEVLNRTEVDYTYTDEYGDEYTYCKDCNSGIYCKECGNVLNTYDDDDVCYSCAKCRCENCYEALSDDEYSHTDAQGTDYYTCQYCNETIAAVSTGIEGTYTLSAFTMSGEEVPLDTAPEMTLTVYSDGTAEMYNGVALQNLTWTQSGDQISFVGDNGIADVFTIQGDQLVYDMNDIYMVFNK